MPSLPDDIAGIRLQSNDYLYLGLLLSAGLYLFFSGLGAFPLRAYDEAFYALAARDVLTTNHLLIPHLYWHGQYQPYLEKPPLGMWLQAISMLVFGQTEFAVRVPNATAGFLISVVLYGYGRLGFSRRVGFLSGLAWLTTPYIVGGMNASRNGGLELIFIFFGLSSLLLAAYYTTSRQRMHLLSAALFAVASFYTKGLQCGIFLIIALPGLVYYRDVIRAEWRDVSIAIAVFVIPVVSYFGVATLLVGSEVYETMVVAHVIGRIGDPVARQTLIPFFKFPYGRLLFYMFDPGVFVLLSGTPLFASTILRKRAEWRQAAMCLYWFASVIVFFGFTGNHAWYIIPGFAGACVLIGYIIDRALGGDRAALAVLVVAAVVALAISARSPVGIQYQWSVRGGRTGILFALTVLGALGAIFAASTFEVPKRKLVTVLFTVLLVTALVQPPAVTTTKAADQEAHATLLVNDAPGGEPMFITHDAARNGMFTYFWYVDRPIRLRTIGEMNNQSAIRYAVVMPDQLDQLDREYQIIAFTNDSGGLPRATVTFNRRTQ